ncbi:MULTISPECIES: ATP-binding protein [Kitasatospora]|uniref:Putative regulatory protein n=1 Tax=Kitasatospora setae (strain ATCC 33774 / DSM 43861 / JCM 3304 / KCC A-0304 / NBRC 14216 / KM-6054) TaxID=452652 RepID=E4N5R4_KITSK|nr:MULTISPECIES: ATP-binding protein [Kitasatospora]BAJ26545.1 putative regulatory protein [Kitasatospora setae KM-6054]
MGARPSRPTGPAGPVRGGPERRSLPLTGAPGTVARGREFTRLALRAWGWLPAPDDDGRTAAEDVLLMAGELVTNACQHAAGPYLLELASYGPLLRVAVRDADDRPPVLRPARVPARPGGYGLRVVDRLALAWGCEPVPGGGKTVWLEVVRPPAAAAVPSARPDRPPAEP